MSFGLNNGPASFQGAISMVLVETEWQFALVYPGGIIAYSNVITEQLGHVCNVLRLLQNARTATKVVKVLFL